jgi:type III restriction enzyme
VNKHFVFKTQKYQTDAVDSVIKVFEGQPNRDLERISFVSPSQLINEDEIYFANYKIQLSGEQLKSNISAIQKQNSLQYLTKFKPPSSSKTKKKIQPSKLDEVLNLTTEMETGTGKTFVYTKTIFELNKNYGWNKFIIMVPSIAIREGVNKSLQITEDYFFDQYKKRINYFIYDNKNSNNLINIKKFNQSNEIQVMIINHQAFNTSSKEGRKINQRLDQLQSQRPIDLIKGTNPVVIIDEPQNFAKAEDKIVEFNPMAVLRYSATHKKEPNKIYRLDSLDAHNKKLVKNLEACSVEQINSSATSSYLYFDKIILSKVKGPVAYVEIEQKTKTGIRKVLRKLEKNDDLYMMSNKLQQYKDFVVSEIESTKGAESGFIKFSNGVKLEKGQVVGEVDSDQIKRIQIRETIKAHLTKELKFFEKNIKVLSLFFIDAVGKYKSYDEENIEVKGIYQVIFEEEYKRATEEIINSLQVREPFEEEYVKYLKGFDNKKVHEGYFAIDKKGKAVESKTGESQSDQSAYDLIMKDKETLLDFNGHHPVRFLFSHSALKEGWDNPNVFQICTLGVTKSDTKMRQQFGRGMRIAVNRDGNRLDAETEPEKFSEINTLTAIVNESYKEFADKYQKELVEDLSTRPTKLTKELLIGSLFTSKSGEVLEINAEHADSIHFDLIQNSYLDKDYFVTEKFIDDFESDNVKISEEFAPYQDDLIELVSSVYEAVQFENTKLSNARDKDIEEKLTPNANFEKKEFQTLWKKIRTKTDYTVNFQTEELISKAVDAINNELVIAKPEIKVTMSKQKEVWTEQEVSDNEISDVTSTKQVKSENILGETKFDLVKEVTEATELTRKTIVEILRSIADVKFDLFKMNPNNFISEVSRLINEQKATTLIESIVYKKIDEQYGNEIFSGDTIEGSSGHNIVNDLNKHIYDYLKTDSEVEKRFAANLDVADNISVYAKLPGGFKIKTPIGDYNPDWAIVIDEPDSKHIYFIAETKGSMSKLDLRGKENTVISYAKKHFEAIAGATSEELANGESGPEIKYDVVKSYEDLLNIVSPD